MRNKGILRLMAALMAVVLCAAAFSVTAFAYVVQPVFKKENANTLGAILLRLMQADCENSR